MSSGGALPQPLNSAFSQFATLVPFTHLPPFQAPVSLPHRLKFKRSRQRVDAGEPRNSYQANRTAAMLQQRFPNGFQFGGANENGGSELGALFPWMNSHTSSESATDTEIIKDFDVVQDLSQHNAADIEEDAGGSCKSLLADEDRHSNDEEKGNGEPILREDRECMREEKRGGEGSSPLAGGSTVGGGSSSRRKNALPQRQHFVEEPEEPTDNHVAVETESEECVADEPDEVKPVPLTVPQSTLAATLAANSLNQQNKIQEMFEIQRRIYSNWMEQQKKLAGANEEEQKRSQAVVAQQQVQRDFGKLAQSLKQEILNTLTGSIDKVIADFAAAEAAANAQRLAAAQQQEREQNAVRSPFMFHPLYHPFNGQSFGHHFMQAPSVPPTGIFPSAAPHTPFTPFISHLKAASPVAAAFRKADDLSPFAPRKKRSKVTDCTRLNKSGAIRDSSLPDSARSSPQLSSYFPPTMVGHPLYGGGSFNADERESPANSDDTSDCGPYDGNVNASYTLTPMHLRKAKLMFFYTRYPNSALLKSYFPDIRFNKNNTAQLVKWFSNFREFFYNQMDKYARNYLAEGVKNKEEIVVTTESEIYKNLNQHYNRNNHIQPPERLELVVQETLREFFHAIQNARDVEPSWKKTIYKIINRMDDPIPEYFKDPNFLDRLEG